MMEEERQGGQKMIWQEAVLRILGAFFTDCPEYLLFNIPVPEMLPEMSRGQWVITKGAQ